MVSGAVRYYVAVSLLPSRLEAEDLAIASHTSKLFSYVFFLFERERYEVHYRGCYQSSLETEYKKKSVRQGNHRNQTPWRRNKERRTKGLESCLAIQS